MFPQVSTLRCRGVAGRKARAAGTGRPRATRPEPPTRRPAPRWPAPRPLVVGRPCRARAPCRRSPAPYRPGALGPPPARRGLLRHDRGPRGCRPADRPVGDVGGRDEPGHRRWRVHQGERHRAPVCRRRIGGLPADGTGLSAPLPDVWIPDSSLWLAVARKSDVGSRRIVAPPRSIVTSPTVIAMSRARAVSMGWPGRQPGWSTLTAHGAGGTVAVTDPRQRRRRPRELGRAAARRGRRVRRNLPRPR